MLQIAIEHIKSLRSGKHANHKSANANGEQSSSPSNEDHSMIFEMDADVRDDRRQDADGKEKLRCCPPAKRSALRLHAHRSE